MDGEIARLMATEEHDKLQSSSQSVPQQTIQETVSTEADKTLIGIQSAWTQESTKSESSKATGGAKPKLRIPQRKSL